jgi:rubrerythrin
MNWKELDEDEHHHPLKDALILLKDIPEGQANLDEVLVNLKDGIDTHVMKFRQLLNEFIFTQRKLNTILSESDDVLMIMKRLHNVEGYDKIMEGIDMYTKSLDINSITAKYSELTKSINEYREVFKSLRELEKYTCSVCLEAMCDMFLDPCGHTVCNECSARVDKKCPYCRGTIFKAKRMIFS